MIVAAERITVNMKGVRSNGKVQVFYGQIERFPISVRRSIAYHLVNKNGRTVLGTQSNFLVDTYICFSVHKIMLMAHKTWILRHRKLVLRHSFFCLGTLNHFLGHIF